MCSQIKGDAGESRICAGGKTGEGVCDVRVAPADACKKQFCWCFLSEVSFSSLFPQKDNGGPLVCQEHERKVIVGVSIQRTKCASSQPALFVNVAFYSEWIYKVFKLYPNAETN